MGLKTKAINLSISFCILMKSYLTLSWKFLVQFRNASADLLEKQKVDGPTKLPIKAFSAEISSSRNNSSLDSEIFDTKLQ